MTSFPIALQQFRAYSWNLHPSFGEAVDQIISAYTSNALVGMGDASEVTDLSPDPFGKPDTPQVTMVPSKINIVSPPVSTIARASPQELALSLTNDLDNMVNGVAKSYLNVMGAYYGTQAQVNNLKLAAGGNVATQTVNTAKTLFGSFPTSWYIFGAIGLVGLVFIMSDKGSRGRR